MNILFVMEHPHFKCSTHALANYMRVGARHGHTIAIYGPRQPHMPNLRFSTDIQAFDRVIFLFESRLYRVKPLQEVSLLAGVPRRHRFILDADAKYNPVIEIDGYDRNYFSEAERAEWLAFYDAISDRVLKPTLLPPDDRRVTALPFYGYDEALVVDPRTAPPKQYDVLYVGHNWWRWKEVAGELVPAFAEIRDQIGEIGFIGMWWDGSVKYEPGHCIEPAFRVETEAFRRLRIRTATAVPYTDVIRTMSTGRVNIFLQRPLLKHQKHLTQRYFEELCADTIPLLMLDDDLAEEVYGPAARELTLPGRVAEKILDALRRPEHYREVVQEVRRHLLAHHAYDARVEDLVAVLDGGSTPGLRSASAPAGGGAS